MLFRSDELIKGHTYTLWAVVWNKPENCTTPYQCTDVDFGKLMQVEVELLWAAGRLAWRDGTGYFLGRLREGDDSRSANPFFGWPGFGGMQDVETAELHFVVRSHGPAIRGQIRDQLSSYEGGCTTFFPPFDQVPMNPGECGDLHFSIFPPGC